MATAILTTCQRKEFIIKIPPRLRLSGVEFKMQLYSGNGHKTLWLFYVVRRQTWALALYANYVFLMRLKTERNNLKFI